jgi:hypothetical protein
VLHVLSLLGLSAGFGGCAFPLSLRLFRGREGRVGHRHGVRLVDLFRIGKKCRSRRGRLCGAADLGRFSFPLCERAECGEDEIAVTHGELPTRVVVAQVHTQNYWAVTVSELRALSPPFRQGGALRGAGADLMVNISHMSAQRPELAEYGVAHRARVEHRVPLCAVHGVEVHQEVVEPGHASVEPTPRVERPPECSSLYGGALRPACMAGGAPVAAFDGTYQLTCHPG